jgi:AcrR family transcriptional regulator
VSFRELAQSAGVSVPTLKHYFEDREGVIAAALEHARKLGAPYLLMMTRPPDGPLRESVLGTMRFLAMGWPMGLDKCHAMGLAQGLEEPRLGPAYVNEVLEPTTQAFEARLAHFAARGELKDCSLRSRSSRRCSSRCCIRARSEVARVGRSTSTRFSSSTSSVGPTRTGRRQCRPLREISPSRGRCQTLPPPVRYGSRR